MGKKKEELVKIEKIPGFLKNMDDSGRGNEQVGNEDIIIPRVDVAQALSPQIDQNEAKYIPELKAGDLFNSVTGKIYGREIKVCPVAFKKEFVIFKDRKFGGGFAGSFPTLDEANEAKAQLDVPSQYEILDSHQHFILVVDGDDIEEAVISMTKTKCKVSRQWNTLIRMNGGDRFSRIYKLGTASQKNDKGTFANFTIANYGFVTEKIYYHAEGIYEMVISGRAKAAMDIDENPTPEKEY